MSADPFTRDQFQWLRQVAFDSDLPPVASRVAAALTKYFNRKNGGWSWMSQDTIATDLRISLRTASSAFTALVDRGHVVRKRRGREETNLYKLALKDGGDTQETADHDTQETAHHSSGVIRKSTSSDTQDSVKVIRENLRTNPLKEPIEEPIERKTHSGRRQSDNDAFAEFWKAYPKRVAQTAALKAYRAILTKGLATPEELLAGAKRYAAEQSGQDPKYTKHPATWLNGGCWADETAPAIQRSPGAGYDHIAMGAELARQIMEEEARDGQ